MPVAFHIPGPLRGFADGCGRVELAGHPKTLRDAFEALWARHPGIRDRVVTEQDQIRDHINVFVGNEDVRYTGGLVTPLSADAEISIIAAVSGG